MINKTTPPKSKQIVKKKNSDKEKRELISPPKGSKIPLFFICLIGISITAFSTILIYTLYDLQINQHEDYSKLASRQHWKRITEQPARGDIVDANGQVLAGTTYVYTVGVTPSNVKSRKTSSITQEDIANFFATTLNLNVEDIKAGLAKKEATYVQLGKNITKEQIDPLKKYIKENQIGGITIDTVARRYYKENSLASQIVGLAKEQNGVLQGELGVELQYNQELTGKAGYYYVEVDLYSGGALPYSVPTTIEVENGYNLMLNIELEMQKIAEKACEDIYSAYNVQDGVTAIVMNPYKGSVLALASAPDFNPNFPIAKPDLLSEEYWEKLDEEEQLKFIMSRAWRNRAISDTYEPGSTFKTLTAAMALEEGLTQEGELFSDAAIQATSIHTIKCWMENMLGYNHGTETLKDAFARSCNPIFVQLSDRIGIKKFYKYVESFGFFDTTGIDLPAEGKGIFHSKPTKIDMNVLSFGESSTVTPLQLINAYSAVVNGGTLMTPRIAKALTDSQGNIVKEFHPEIIRSVISENTAKRIQDLMKGVVNEEEGTGAEGRVPGYLVAGKTSTATIDFGDFKGDHILSFAGYAPFDDPSIVVLVVINRPKDKEVGSSIAARAASDIIRSSLNYMKVQPKFEAKDYTDLNTRFKIPNVVGKTFKEAKDELYREGFSVDLSLHQNVNLSSIVTEMSPAPGSEVLKKSPVFLATEKQSIRDVAVPDFTGKTMLEAIFEAESIGLNVIFEGDIGEGRAFSQDIGIFKEETEAKASEEAKSSESPLPSDTKTTEEETSETKKENIGLEEDLTNEETTFSSGTDVSSENSKDKSQKNYLKMGSVITITIKK